MAGTPVATVNPDGTLNTNATSIYNSTQDKSYNNGLDKDSFLQLLVAEMRNQDPLEPSSNTEYVAQLATFTQVEEMQNMAASMSQNQANQLIGKLVIMNTLTGTGSSSFIGGIVDRVVNDKGKTYLGINGSLYDIDDLNSILNEDYYQIVNGGTGVDINTPETDDSQTDDSQTDGSQTDTDSDGSK